MQRTRALRSTAAHSRNRIGTGARDALAVWRRQGWPLQDMGFAEWDLLADMALAASAWVPLLRARVPLLARPAVPSAWVPLLAGYPLGAAVRTWSHPRAHASGCPQFIAASGHWTERPLETRLSGAITAKCKATRSCSPPIAPQTTAECNRHSTLKPGRPASRCRWRPWRWARCGVSCVDRPGRSRRACSRRWRGSRSAGTGSRRPWRPGPSP